MLYPRIIPCLLVHQKGLVKTVKFDNPKYVGDPINAVKIFNEKSVDELMVLDIDATINNREPDYQMISNLAMECRMPLCYGGGIKTAKQARKIFKLGVEKIAISSIAIEKPEIITELAESVGNQSVIVVLDVKKKKFGNQYEIYTHNASKKTEINPIAFAKQAEKLGAGEIVLNSIDKDGLMDGYDHIIVDMIRESISLPMTVLGGAGSLAHLGSLINKHGIIGVAAGSLFVFKGKYRAVLINYPRPKEKKEMIKESLAHFLNRL